MSADAGRSRWPCLVAGRHLAGHATEPVPPHQITRLHAEARQRVEPGRRWRRDLGAATRSSKYARLDGPSPGRASKMPASYKTWPSRSASVRGHLNALLRSSRVIAGSVYTAQMSAAPRGCRHAAR